jgi:hypothetical protein
MTPNPSLKKEKLRGREIETSFVAREANIRRLLSSKSHLINHGLKSMLQTDRHTHRHTDRQTDRQTTKCFLYRRTDPRLFSLGNRCILCVSLSASEESAY